MVNALQKALNWIEEKLDPRCTFCEWRGACAPWCPSLACPECGGLGVVIDYDARIGIDSVGNPTYAGKPCPRGCSSP